MNPLTGLTVITLVALVVTGCALPISVTSYMERDADLSRYETFAWGRVDDQPTGDPRLDSNAIFHERVRAEAERWLTRRGFLKVNGNADITVRYRLAIIDEIETPTIDRVTGYCPDNKCAAYLFQSGTLAFELADARTQRTLWRGWATGTVDGVVNDQKKLEEMVGDVVARVFERLPARSE
jgi:hypothetical protein